VPLPGRRRLTVAALVAPFTFTLTYWTLGYPRGPAFAALVIALATVVMAGHRRAALLVVVAGFLSFPWLGYLVGREKRPELGQVIGLAAWLIALVSVI